ncbi:HAD family phosphatase [Maribacter sp. ANRC-HE7]|uniref:HAD family phosphatase n=1 Tax=Maribacter aquimaris TaxID=2737171 RepID=A0ABR7UWR4_9FLAO|nr:HAD family phosphatase [Maribacter aquimaris]MBD0776783.1 HAD family phosphatase [Maribacter aquimaris]
MITTIIFDMNGVITDDEDCHELATEGAFKEIGFEMTPEIYRKFCLGRTDVSAFKDIMGTYGIEHVEINDLIAAKTRQYMVLVKGNLRVFDGVIDLIKRLYKSYDLALTTSSTYEEANAVIDLLRLHKYFKVVVTSKDVTKGKPDPEPYLLTADKLGVPTVECLVIEDSENGVKSAKAAGMACVAITNSEKPDQLVLADRIVSTYSEITVDFIDIFGS